jgi:hypothetical protein
MSNLTELQIENLTEFEIAFLEANPEYIESLGSPTFNLALVMSIPADELDQKNDEARILYRLAEYNYNRLNEVKNIIITLADGVTSLDGNEASQDRMSRAILGMSEDTIITWVGASGNIYNLNKIQLTEALALSIEAQTAIWIKYSSLKSAIKVEIPKPGETI